MVPTAKTLPKAMVMEVGVINMVAIQVRHPLTLRQEVELLVSRMSLLAEEAAVVVVMVMGRVNLAIAIR